MRRHLELNDKLTASAKLYVHVQLVRTRCTCMCIVQLVRTRSYNYPKGTLTYSYIGAVCHLFIFLINE